MKHKKILFPLLVMGMLVLTGLGASAISGNNYRGIVTETLENVEQQTPVIEGIDENDGTHTVFSEYGTATWCGYCKYAHGALKQLYAEGKDFYYVSLVGNKNSIAQQRINQYNAYGYPTVWWDGGYRVDVGAGSIPSAKITYTNSINQCAARAVPDLDLDLEVHWLGNTKMSVEATIKNNDPNIYRGHLRVYITEKESSMNWKDTAGNPYTFAFLDYAFNEQIAIQSGGTWNDYVEWTGSNHGFNSITLDNIMVIGAVFNNEKHQGYSYPPSSNPFDAYYVDEVTGAEPMTLWSDTYEIPETGGTVNFYLSADIDNAGSDYFLLGGATGTDPGTTLPGGGILPINWDAITDLIFSIANTPVCQNFQGNLDSNGIASAQLNLPDVTGNAGVDLYFAYTTYSPFDFQSNPVTVSIV